MNKTEIVARILARLRASANCSCQGCSGCS